MNRCNPKEGRMSILQTLKRELGKRKSFLFEVKKLKQEKY